MRDKIKEIQAKIEQDPKLQEAVNNMKPKKSFWGIMGILLLFFIPEIVIYFWNEELISWTHEHSLTEPIASQRWLYSKLEEMFRSGVSWVNIGLGIALLWWVIKSK